MFSLVKPERADAGSPFGWVVKELADRLPLQKLSFKSRSIAITIHMADCESKVGSVALAFARGMPSP
jgi:hypothetical protein